MSRKPQLVVDALKLLEDRSLDWEPLQGGDLSAIFRIRLQSGSTVIAKSGPSPDSEAIMLRALINAGARAPKPIASNAIVLVLEDLGAEARQSDSSWRSLGENLRAVHAVRGRGYGWENDYAFGPVRIRNGWSDTWSDFWFGKRLAADIHALPAEVACKLQNLELRIRELLPDQPQPSLLHGDLWSGNVHFHANGKAFLIDPASYFGHAEVDLAMLTLFGSPPKEFWDAYGELEAGWEKRRRVYQLWPALVHLRLFGAGYRRLVEHLISTLE